ncbi:MAG: fibronectin type III domain-containing protein, partial [Elusimicrobia bacterium]|nr:fibronectin type III domain-containing protein [Elusimicrobiota bacterium]
TGLNPGTTYYFAIKAVDEAGLTGSWATASNPQRFAMAQDLVPPVPTGVGATGADHSAAVTWNAVTGEPDLDVYKIYYSSTAPYTDFFLAGSTPTSFTSFQHAGLLNETTYVYKVSVVDLGTVGDFPSAVLESTSTVSATTVTLDSEAPGAIGNLAAFTGTTEGEIRLTWTAPGDDGASMNIAGGRLRIDYSTNVNYTFSTSTYQVNQATSVGAGEDVAQTLTNLTGGATYYIRVWNLDEALNSGGLSNGATIWAQRDVTSPASITNLGATAVWRRVNLSWTSPGDNGSLGTLSGQFRVRYSTDHVVTEATFDTQPYGEIVIPAFSEPGIVISTYVNGLTNGQAYYFAVRAEDDASNAGTVIAGSTAQAVPSNNLPGTFSLTSPADGFITADASPAFGWNAAANLDSVYGDVLTYTLEYSTDAAFAGGVTSFAGITGLSYDIGSSVLVEDVTTYWRVTAADADGATRTASQAYSIFLNQTNTAPAAFNLLTPADGTNVNTTRPTLDWADSSDTDPGNSITYRVEYSLESSFTSFTSSAGLAVSQITLPVDLSENTTYYWRAFATDGSSTTAASQASFLFHVDAVDSLPFTFGLLSPADGTRIATTTINFSWEASSDPDPMDSVTYNLVFSNFANFANATTVTGLSSPAYSTTTADNIPMYWYVEAEDASGDKRRSSGSHRVLTVDVEKELPTAFELLTPTGSVLVTTLKPFLQWTAAVDPDPLENVRYSLDLSNRPDFVGTQGIPLTDTFFQVTNNLLDDTTYYWRVRAGGYRGVPPVLQDSGETLVAGGVFVVSVANTAPGDFGLLTPADNSNAGTITPAFDWEDAVDVDVNDTLSYTLSIATSADFSGGQTITGLTTSYYTMTSPILENRTYYWKVAAADKEGAVTVSRSVFRFAVPILNRPKAPTGLIGAMASNRSSFSLVWHPVFANTDGSPV